MTTTLKAQLRTDLTSAMKARDELRSATIRMALSAITTEEVAGKVARELSDDEVLKILGREVKKRKEAAEAFAGAGRAEQAAREVAEGEVLTAYLPAQLSDEELQGLVDAAVAETGAEGPRAMGAVMKVLTPRVAGRADGSRISAAVKAKLS
jgi:uncharacterized protein